MDVNALMDRREALAAEVDQMVAKLATTLAEFDETTTAVGGVRYDRRMPSHGGDFYPLLAQNLAAAGVQSIGATGQPGSLAEHVTHEHKPLRTEET